MKIITSLLLVCFWSNCFGETNSPLAAPQLFSLPSLPLRPPIAVSEDGVPPLEAERDDEPTAQTGTNSGADLPGLVSEPVPGDFPEPTTLTTEESLLLGYYERLERGGYLTPPIRPPENFYARTVNAIFQPEVMRVGKAFVAFSPITAIKKKNPLALLNPIVLNIAW